MIKRDFHVHTTFCDGKKTPEEIIKSAISQNLTAIGLVCHAFTPCDESYCIKRENVKRFTDEINCLKAKYKDEISVFCGVEYDYFAQMDTSYFDYVIGAVHYVFKDNNYISIDESKQSLINSVNKFYDGDFYAFCADYYKTLGDIYSKVTPSFIAHFDLVSKFNENSDLFDENDGRYICVWQSCLDELIKRKAIFEINLGAMVRGYKTKPYPSASQIDYIIKNGGKFILSSDSHSDDSLAYNFNKYFSLIGKENFTQIF